MCLCPFSFKTLFFFCGISHQPAIFWNISTRPAFPGWAGHQSSRFFPTPPWAFLFQLAWQKAPRRLISAASWMPTSVLPLLVSKRSSGHNGPAHWCLEITQIWTSKHDLQSFFKHFAMRSDRITVTNAALNHRIIVNYIYIYVDIIIMIYINIQI